MGEFFETVDFQRFLRVMYVCTTLDEIGPL